MGLRPCDVCLVPLAVSWILLTPGVLSLPQNTYEADSILFNHPNITFLMYPTPEVVDEPQMGDPDVLIPAHPLTLVFHGFKGDRSAKSMESVKDALLENGMQNVVVVDWSPLADAPNMTALDSYHHVVAHGVREAASLSYHWLKAVMDMKALTPEDLHLIGFSLGAHAVGVLGNLFNSSVARISGLDPPKFGYESAALHDRLDETDAQFVNVIHTSAGILSYPEAIGHVDFFPNGDVVPQVGCPEESPIDIITCSHYFSFAVFAESVFNKDSFLATECESWQGFKHGDCADRPQAPMGYHTPDTVRGMYFMETKDKPPYGAEDPDNPLPDHVREMITYNKDDSFVKPADVVHFLMHEEQELASEVESERDEIQQTVMKVKSKSFKTTTPDPPAFLNSGHLLSAVNTFLISFTWFNVFRLIFHWLLW